MILSDDPGAKTVTKQEEALEFQFQLERATEFLAFSESLGLFVQGPRSEKPYFHGESSMEKAESGGHNKSATAFTYSPFFHSSKKAA